MVSLVHVTEYREPEVLQVKRGSVPTAISHMVRSRYRGARLLGHPRIGVPAASRRPVDPGRIPFRRPFRGSDDHQPERIPALRQRAQRPWLGDPRPAHPDRPFRRSQSGRRPAREPRAAPRAHRDRRRAGAAGSGVGAVRGDRRSRRPARGRRRARGRAGGPSGGAVGGRRDQRLPAGARPARPGRRRPRRPRGGGGPRVRRSAAGLPGRGRGPAHRPARRRRDGPRRPGGAAARWPASAAGPHGQQLPQPAGRHDVAGPPGAAGRARRPVRAARRRGRPVRPARLRRRAAPPGGRVRRPRGPPGQRVQDPPPALRVGWLTGPAPVVAAVERLRQCADLCGSTLTQAIAAELLADRPWLAGHLHRFRTDGAARARVFTAAVDSAFGTAAVRSEAAGGMFCWLEFRDGTDTDALLQRALGRGVAFVPGSAFSVSWPRTDGARCCFATLSTADLQEAAARPARPGATPGSAAGTARWPVRGPAGSSGPRRAARRGRPAGRRRRAVPR